MAEDEEQLATVEKKATLYREHGVAAEVLDGAAVADAEPALREGLLGGLRVPGDSVVYPPAATEWLLARARDHGAAVRCGTAARVDEGVVELSDGGHIEAGVVVDAAGERAFDLLPEPLPGSRMMNPSSQGRRDSASSSFTP